LPSSAPTAAAIDPGVVRDFKAAVERLLQTRPQPLADDSDWPASQAVLLQQAEWIEAFSADLEAIQFPEAVGSRPLVFYSMEMARAARQAAAATSPEAMSNDTIEFGGTSYLLPEFIQEVRGEWQASLSLMADALGVDLGTI
jgi:hypothetical protein